MSVKCRRPVGCGDPSEPSSRASAVEHQAGKAQIRVFPLSTERPCPAPLASRDPGRVRVAQSRSAGTEGQVAAEGQVLTSPEEGKAAAGADSHRCYTVGSPFRPLPT